MIEAALRVAAQRTFDVLRRRELKLATAESCTGGLVSAAVTSIAGSSAVFDRGFVTYSNSAKAEMLGVASDLIRTHGAVSVAVARAMAEGALAHSRADLAVAITGIAGPGADGSSKPVGLVHFALAVRGKPTRDRVATFAGDRDGIRLQAALAALEMVETEG